MDAEELKQIIREVVNEKKSYTRQSPKKKTIERKTLIKKSLEFSKKIMVFASAMYTATWLVAVISWFKIQLLPDELMKYSTYLYGIALTVYGGKSAYENKPKIEAAYVANYYEERESV